MSETLRERADKIVLKWLRSDALYNDSRIKMAAEIAAEIEAAVAEERAQNINDVCMYCGKRAVGWEPATGPNSTGNWTHKHPDYDIPAETLCYASAL